jgi:hypothetical protein
MHDAKVGWVGSQILLYPRSLEMIRPPVHGFVLNQMAATHGGPNRDRRDGDKAVIGMLDDWLFALYFAQSRAACRLGLINLKVVGLSVANG